MQLTQTTPSPHHRGLLIGTGVAAALVLAGGATLAAAAGLLSSGKEGQSVSAPNQTIPPTPQDLLASSQARVFFGHQSVGTNILSGIPGVFADAHVTAPDIVEARQVQGPGPVIRHARIGVNGDPAGKIRDFAALMNSDIGENVDVALMKLCYIDFNADTDVHSVFAEYSTTMDTLERAHPRVTFLYTTAPVTVEPDLLTNLKSTVKAWLSGSWSATPENLVRERYNSLVREKYAATGRLFDIAALEAQLSGGTAGTAQRDGQTYYVGNPALSSDGAHLNEVGSRQLASQLLRLIGESAAG